MWHIFIFGVYSGAEKVRQKIWTPFYEEDIFFKYHCCYTIEFYLT